MKSKERKKEKKEAGERGRRMKFICFFHSYNVFFYPFPIFLFSFLSSSLWFLSIFNPFYFLFTVDFFLFETGLQPFFIATLLSFTLSSGFLFLVFLLFLPFIFTSQFPRFFAFLPLSVRSHCLPYLLVCVFPHCCLFVQLLTLLSVTYDLSLCIPPPPLPYHLLNLHSHHSLP